MVLTEKALSIDIPVVLRYVKSVHSIGSPQFEGDLPAAIFHLQLLQPPVARRSSRTLGLGLRLAF